MFFEFIPMMNRLDDLKVNEKKDDGDDFSLVISQIIKPIEDDLKTLQKIAHEIKDRSEEIVNKGDTQTIVQSALASEDLQETLTSIEDRHHEILRLEREIRDLQTLFIDLAVLVDVQQDHLDHIEIRIANAKDHTEKG